MTKTNILTETVRQGLTGFALRQQARENRRARATSKASITKARRAGLLNTVQAAREWLAGHGIRFREQPIYGMVLLATAPGVLLPYRPTGELDWSARTKCQQAPPPQDELFSISSPGQGENS